MLFTAASIKAVTWSVIWQSSDVDPLSQVDNFSQCVCIDECAARNHKTEIKRKN